MQIQKFPYSRLSDMLASQVMNRLANEYIKLALPELKTKIDPFVEAKDALSDNLRIGKGASPITPGIKKQDPARDRTTNGIFNTVSIGLKSLVAAEATAATHVDTVLRKYGNPVRKPYDEQTRITEKMIDELMAQPMLAHVQKIPGLSPLLIALKSLNTEFASDFNKRISESKGIEKGITNKLRSKANVAARVAAEAINAYILLYPDNPNVEAVIIDVNAILTKARTDLSNRGKGELKVES